jgi:hypothetical protein
MFAHLCLFSVAALLGAGMIPAADKATSTPIVVTESASVAAGLKGAWKVTEQWSRPRDGAWTAGATPHLSIYIFTDKHYSYMFAPGPGPRRLFASGLTQPTDAEKAAAYDTFVAGSGTYALTGTTLTLTAILHKNPHEMTGHPLKYSVELGPDRLQMTIDNPPFAPGLERRTVLARVE